jgi:hypothetical protein
MMVTADLKKEIIMRRFSFYVALASIVFWPFVLAAQNMKPVSKPEFKSIEVKHFTNAEGVQLSSNFSKYFYASFLAELQRLNVAEQTVEEGTPVNDTQGTHGFKPQFIVLEGKFVKVEEGRQKGDKFEAGSANLEIRYFRRSDHRALSFPPCAVCEVFKTKVALNGTLQNEEQKVAESAGVEAADAFRTKVVPGKASWLDQLGI